MEVHLRFYGDLHHIRTAGELNCLHLKVCRIFQWCRTVEASRTAVRSIQFWRQLLPTGRVTLPTRCRSELDVPRGLSKLIKARCPPKGRRQVKSPFGQFVSPGPGGPLRLD